MHETKLFDCLILCKVKKPSGEIILFYERYKKLQRSLFLFLLFTFWDLRFNLKEDFR